jgi:hypothetical protein
VPTRMHNMLILIPIFATSILIHEKYFIFG